MKKVIPCLLAAVLALALCACNQYDDRYEDEAFLSGKYDAYATISWWSHQGENGSCAMGIGSYSGVRTLYGFTVEQDETLCEVTSTLACTEGEAKLLVVNTDDRTIAAEWPVGSGDPMTVTLPAGDYWLRIAGKSAELEGEVTLMLNGQIQEWDGMPDEAEEALDELTDGETGEALQDAKDALQEVQDVLDELPDGDVKDALQEVQDVLDELPDGEAKDAMQDVKDALHDVQNALQSAQSALQEGFGDDRDAA